MKARKSAAPDWLPDIALVPPDLLTIDEAAQEDLRQTLLQQKLPHLRAIAAARGITGRGGQRETLVPALVESLLDPGAQEAVVGALDQPARAVLALARALDWSREPLTSASLRRVLRAGTAVSGELDGALLALADLGLVLPAPAAISRNDPYYQCPAAVAARLLPLLPEVRAYTGDAPADAGPAPAAGPPPVLRKLDAVLAALGAAEYRLAEPAPRVFRGQEVWTMGHWEVVGEAPPPRARPSRDEAPAGLQVALGRPYLTDEAAARLQAAAGLSSPDEAVFFVRLLAAMGLARASGQALVPYAPVLESLRRAPEAVRERETLDAALALDEWSELDMLVAADPTLAVFRAASLHYIEPGHMRTDVSHVRQALMRLLAWLPIGPWYDVNTLLGTLHRCFPELPVTTQPVAGAWEQQTWWLARADGKGGWHYLDRRSSPDWQRGLGRLAGLMLSRTFTWLGLVEATGLDGAPPRPGAAPIGFRLRPPVAALSGRPPALLRVQPRPAGVAPDPAVAPALRFQAAAGGPLLVLDLRAVSLATQMRLAAFADLAHADRDLCAYRLTAASVRAGFDAGLDHRVIAATLAELAGGALPAAVTERLTSWWAAYGRLRFYTGVSLIQFSDDFTLAELLASTPLAGYLLYQFSPRLVAVPSTSVDQLVADLSRAGHTPRVIDESRAAGVA